MNLVYFDCFSGISGNMVLGAFIDAGMELDYLKSKISELNLEEEYKLEAKQVVKKGISSTYFQVHFSKSDRCRHLKTILNIIDNSTLSEKVKQLSSAIFKTLAKAEAKIHGVTEEEIHFHEVGAIDAIIDIVGFAIGIEYFGIDKVYSSSLPFTKGKIRCEHGIFPNPAPATLECLKGALVTKMDFEFELVTPTGAAILSEIAEFKFPDMKIKNIAYGAGTMDFEHPNVLRLVFGDSINNNSIFIIETNIDDMNPEFYGYVMEKVFEENALDVYLTPIYMKKNRPGVKLSVMCYEKDVDKVVKVILMHTTSTGLRIAPYNRVMVDYSIEEFNTDVGVVKIKVSKYENQVINIAPEYEDCKKIANLTGVPLKEIYNKVIAQYWQSTTLNI